MSKCHSAFNSGRAGRPSTGNQWKLGKNAKCLDKQPTRPRIDAEQSLHNFIWGKDSKDPNVRQFFEEVDKLARENPEAPTFAATRHMPLCKLPVTMLALLVLSNLIQPVEAVFVQPEIDLNNLQTPVNRITVHSNAVTMYGSTKQAIKAVTDPDNGCEVLGATIESASFHDRLHPDSKSKKVRHAHLRMGEGDLIGGLDVNHPQFRPVTQEDVNCLSNALVKDKLISSKVNKLLREEAKSLDPLDSTRPDIPAAGNNGIFQQLELKPQAVMAFHLAEEQLKQGKLISCDDGDHGLAEHYVHLDLDGKGPRVGLLDNDRFGFDTAINLLRQDSLTGELDGLEVPARVDVQPNRPYPVADNTADEISMQSDKLLSQRDMKEVARMIRPDGAITLWVNEAPQNEASVKQLAKLVRGKVIYPDPGHPKHNARLIRQLQLPQHLLHEEQASNPSHQDRVIIIAGNPKTYGRKDELR